MLKGEPPSLRIIKQRKLGVVSPDFIRIKMAEASPPDKGHLWASSADQKKKKKNIFEGRQPKHPTTTGSSASELLPNNGCVSCSQPCLCRNSE